jgi:hypothetical protein
MFAFILMSTAAHKHADLTEYLGLTRESVGKHSVGGGPIGPGKMTWNRREASAGANHEPSLCVRVVSRYYLSFVDEGRLWVVSQYFDAVSIRELLSTGLSERCATAALCSSTPNRRWEVGKLGGGARGGRAREADGAGCGGALQVHTLRLHRDRGRAGLHPLNEEGAPLRQERQHPAGWRRCRPTDRSLCLPASPLPSARNDDQDDQAGRRCYGCGWR